MPQASRAGSRRGMAQLGRVAALVPLLAGSCAGLDRSDQGVLQPQTVAGPCSVKKFFLVRFSSTPVEFAVVSGGEPCTVTLVNLDLQIVLTAALITVPPVHGRATATLITGARQAAISYAPQPGYTGPDHFDVTLEPNAVSLSIGVVAGPDRSQ